MKLHLDVRVLKGTALALAVVLVVLVGLLCLQHWDESQGQVAESDAAGESPTVSEDSREVTYVDGQAYALRDLETILLLGVDKFEGETPEGYLNNQQADFLLLLALDKAGETCTPIPAEPGHHDGNPDSGGQRGARRDHDRPAGPGPHLRQRGRGQL